MHLKRVSNRVLKIEGEKETERWYYKQHAPTGLLRRVLNRVFRMMGVKDARVPKRVKGRNAGTVNTMLVLGC